MKAILEFNLPEDKEDFDFATNAVNYYSALVEFDQWLRSEYKYNGNDKGDFTIGDDFKFSFEIGKREISQISFYSEASVQTDTGFGQGMWVGRGANGIPDVPSLFLDNQFLGLDS